MRITLGKVRGIPMHLHESSTVLLALYLGWTLISSGLGAVGAAAGFIVLLMVSVLLHELGHALVARRFGVGTRDITLYPFGGVAMLTREPPTPRAELLVALAGPAVSFALAALGIGVGLSAGPGLASGALQFGAMNLGLALFNMLPAFPLDGGRALRAWLSRRRGKLAATEAALSVSRVFAWAFIVLGLFGRPSLFIIGVLVHLGIRAERANLRVRRRVADSWTARAEPAPEVVLRSRLWSHPTV